MSEESAMFTPPRNENQISDFPGQTTFITGHNQEGKAIIHEKREAKWVQFDDKQMAFNQVYTNEFHADLNNDADVKHCNDTFASHQGLVVKNSVLTRQVDLAPGYKCIMHRTKSLDFGIVLEGQIDMMLDDGSVSRLRRGDVAVQRATMHAWRNPSDTEFARMQFILQDIKPLVVNGQAYGEDLSAGDTAIPPSGNEE